MDAGLNDTDGLDGLIGRLWAAGPGGRDRVAALLSAIEAVAPAAIDQAHARRVARQLGLDRRAASARGV